MEGAPRLTVVIPAYDEQATIGGVLEEVAAVVGRDPREAEILVVDDGSRDRTPAILREHAASNPALRILTFERNCGQSAALAAGFLAARGELVVTLDGDGQSDAGDIPRLVELLAACDMVNGIRRRRRDSLGKRLGSRFANWARRRFTGDRIEDICCPVKGFRRGPLQRLPYFDGAHRFLPVLLALEGCSIVQVEVNHRPRAGGRSKYTNLGRLKRAWQDVLGVRWLQSRHLDYRIKETAPERPVKVGP